MKFDYGETYEGHTYKYFQDFRSKALETSKSNYCKGGYLPTIYSYNPQVAHAGRKADRARWLHAPRYALTDIDYDRKEDIIHFEKVLYHVSSCHVFLCCIQGLVKIHGEHNSEGTRRYF